MILRQNAEQLVSAAHRSGSRQVRGPVGPLDLEGNLWTGDVGLQELLCELASREVLVVVAPVGVAPEPPGRCPLCGRAFQEGGECPLCAAEGEAAKRFLAERLLFDEGFSSLLCW